MYYLIEGIDSIVSFLQRSGTADLNKVLFFVNKNIAGYFDFEHMARLAAGRYWRNLNRGQMYRLRARLKTMFIKSLSSNLVKYTFTNRKIRFFPPKRSRFSNVVVVRAVVTHPHGFPSRLSFRFHPTPQGWKIYDVSAGGQSAIMYYRRKIRQTVARFGIQSLVN